MYFLKIKIIYFFYVKFLIFKKYILGVCTSSDFIFDFTVFVRILHPLFFMIVDNSAFLGKTKHGCSVD
jgi:NADH:ubiquinone oxidoreductase subunit 4 (subunit M)